MRRVALGPEAAWGTHFRCLVGGFRKDIVVSLQAHSNDGGWTESFNPDEVSQLLVYRPVYVGL